MNECHNRMANRVAAVGSDGAECIGQEAAGNEAGTMHTLSRNKAVGKLHTSSDNEETEALRLRKERIESRSRPVGINSRQSSREATRRPCRPETDAAVLRLEASCANTPIVDVTRSFLIGLCASLKGPFPSLLISATFSDDLPLQAGTCCTENTNKAYILLDFRYSVVWVEYALN